MPPPVPCHARTWAYASGLSCPSLHDSSFRALRVDGRPGDGDQYRHPARHSIALKQRPGRAQNEPRRAR